MKKLLEGKRVRLAALRPEDLSTVAHWFENDEFFRLFDARPAYPRTEADLKEWLEEQRKSSEAFVFAIRLVETDALIGYLEIDGILWAHRVGWTSVGIGDAAYWGRGYGYEAMELALGFAFNELNLHRVQLTVFSYNERAIALYEKLGFRREGTFREFLERDGARYAMHLYGILRPDWKEMGH